MFLATTKVEDFDRWWSVFTTTSLEKRKQHGSKGSQTFRDPMSRAGCGCSSTGMRRAGRTSSPTPRSRRSFKKPGTQVGHSWRKSLVSSTASAKPGSLQSQD